MTTAAPLDVLFNFRVSAETAEKVAEAAARDGRSRSDLMREALGEVLAAHEHGARPAAGTVPPPQLAAAA